MLVAYSVAAIRRIFVISLALTLPVSRMAWTIRSDFASRSMKDPTERERGTLPRGDFDFAELTEEWSFAEVVMAFPSNKKVL